MTTFRTELRDIDHEVGYKELDVLKSIAEDKNMEYFVKVDTYNENLIKKIIQLKPSGIIFTGIPGEETIKLISEEEAR